MSKRIFSALDVIVFARSWVQLASAQYELRFKVIDVMFLTGWLKRYLTLWLCGRRPCI